MPRRPPPRSLAAPEDFADSDFARAVGSPGVLPFTRGVQPDMYRGRAWTMYQYAGFAIEAEAAKLLARINAGEAVVVDVNHFVQRDDEATERGGMAFRLDPELERQQIERVRAVRAGRSRQECRAALARVGQAAHNGSNLVPPIIAAVEARATLGEVTDALRLVFGAYHSVSTA